MKRLLRLAALAFLVAATNVATVKAVELQAILRDTQRTTNDGNNYVILWWVPQLYWEQTFRTSTQLSEDGKGQVLKLLSNYVLVAVIDVQVDALGAFHGRNATEVGEGLRLSLSGEEMDFISEEELPDAMKNLLSGMRPALQNSLGAVGRSMQIFVYPSGAKDGRGWEHQKGHLEIRYQSRTQRWRLPLACTLPDRVDAKTSEHFPGDFLYNPYTGERLN